MHLPRTERGATRLSDSQIEAARVGAALSIVELAERGGVIMDPRKSQPAKGDYWAVCCFHAEKSASLHIVDRVALSYFKCFGCGEKGDAIELAQRLFNINFPDAVRMLGGEVNFEPDPELIAAREQMRREREAEAERQRVSNRAASKAVFFGAGVHVAGTLGELYFRRARAIGAGLAHADLRFHSRAPLNPYDPANGGRCPAIVARILNAEGEQIGAHLTFLQADGSGKRCFDWLDGDARMMCGEHKGGFIRLGNVRDAAVVGEGIETTLSASEACGLPGLAAINAGNMAELIWPPSIRRLVIAPDRGAAGELAADALAQRAWAAGLDVELMPPPDGFGDWNDAAQAGALSKLEACA